MSEAKQVRLKVGNFTTTPMGCADALYTAKRAQPYFSKQIEIIPVEDAKEAQLKVLDGGRK